jgi:hypothetical protein
MAAVVSNDKEGGQRPWADVWPDCSPEDEAAQSRTRSRGKVGFQIEASE